MKNRRLLYILAVTGTMLLFTACSATSKKDAADAGVIDGGAAGSAAANEAVHFFCNMDIGSGHRVSGFPPGGVSCPCFIM